MDNHFHAVVQCEELARVMADLKKFTAHRLLAQIEAEQRGWVVSPEHWRYSSAHEWLPGAEPVLRCDDWR